MTWGKGQYGEKCDVYSFAVIMWEIVTRQHPFGNKGFDDLRLQKGATQGDELKAVREALAKGERPTPQPIGYGTNLSKLIIECWHQNPKKRPSFSTILVCPLFHMQDPQHTSNIYAQ
jgi:hypothetical protein